VKSKDGQTKYQGDVSLESGLHAGGTATVAFDPRKGTANADLEGGVGLSVKLETTHELCLRSSLICLQGQADVRAGLEAKGRCVTLRTVS
jgi:hypothetical protein